MSSVILVSYVDTIHVTCKKNHINVNMTCDGALHLFYSFPLLYLILQMTGWSTVSIERGMGLNSMAVRKHLLEHNFLSPFVV